MSQPVSQWEDERWKFKHSVNSSERLARLLKSFNGNTLLSYSTPPIFYWFNFIRPSKNLMLNEIIAKSICTANDRTSLIVFVPLKIYWYDMRGRRWKLRAVRLTTAKRTQMQGQTQGKNTYKWNTDKWKEWNKFIFLHSAYKHMCKQAKVICSPRSRKNSQMSLRTKRFFR